MGSHAAVAAELLGDREMVAAILADYRTAPVSDKYKALFAYLERLNDAPASITVQHVDAVKAAGWSEEAIYDAVTVMALFNFYNRWIDGTGVQDLPAAAYELSGKRMAAHGYAEEDEASA